MMIKDNDNDCHSLSHWEKGVTTRLHRQILPQNNSNRGFSSTIRDEGTHAQMRWMEWPSDQFEKNQHGDKTNGGNQTPMTRHLFINIVLEEDPCAQLALCFAQNITNHDPIRKESSMVIDKFGFVLTKGQRMLGLLPVLEWLESTFGCSVSPQPFIFSPRQISTLLLPSLRHNMNNDNVRPLELSFEVIPKNTALETLSLTCENVNKQHQGNHRSIEQIHCPPSMPIIQQEYIMYQPCGIVVFNQPLNRNGFRDRNFLWITL